MKNVTKFNIFRPANELFEAFVDPSNIGNFWFSSSSERWEEGKTILLKYDLYDAEAEIKIVEIEQNKRIIFKWGPVEEEHVVTISFTELEKMGTAIEVIEEGFIEDDEELIHKLVDNKEGWVFMLTCLKGYLEFGVTGLRGGIAK
ncbi:SRPBCC domain-containing protein [Psychrobacillus vulpis]|uniref:Activator of Hsp90 ATPase homologue 1/2-like C-terminal domain-containing protein n=1 Tax=Psychrobacillus vulpis TaxID=2325572 RepID=A0A544TNY7_9BACI|nr:SRPBCC domain-containing protein [Psychrobacillus vulpis]TQR19119.1 hypothetical protein FG384_14005 [Psychrobacillus vulpis]